MAIVTVIVYTKPGCPQCDQTKRLLTAGGVEFAENDVTKSENGRLAVEHLGFSSLPVVSWLHDRQWQHWSGFRVDRIKAIIAAKKGEL